MNINTPALIVLPNTFAAKTVGELVWKRIQGLPEEDRVRAELLAIDTDQASLEALTLPRAYTMALPISGADVQRWHVDPEHHPQAAYVHNDGRVVVISADGTSGRPDEGHTAALAFAEGIETRITDALGRLSQFRPAESRPHSPRVAVYIVAVLGRGTSGCIPLCLDLLESTLINHPEFKASITLLLILPVIGSSDAARKKANAASLLVTLSTAQMVELDLSTGRRGPRRLWTQTHLIGNGNSIVGFVQGQDAMAAWVADMLWVRVTDAKATGSELRSAAVAYNQLNGKDRYLLPTHYSTMGIAEIVWDRHQAAAILAQLWQQQHLSEMKG